MPRTVDAGERRQLLAAAAARVIAQAGVEGATLREVAAEAGLTTGSLTHYFSDKRELLLFTLRASLERRRSSKTESGAAIDQLTAILEGAMVLDDEARQHWLVTIAFCSQAGTDETMAGAQRDAYRGFRRAVVALVRKAMVDGALRDDLDADDEAEHLIALVDGIALQALFDPAAWPPGRQRAHLERALEALTPPRA